MLSSYFIFQKDKKLRSLIYSRCLPPILPARQRSPPLIYGPVGWFPTGLAAWGLQPSPDLWFPTGLAAWGQASRIYDFGKPQQRKSRRTPPPETNRFDLKMWICEMWKMSKCEGGVEIQHEQQHECPLQGVFWWYPHGLYFENQFDVRLSENKGAGNCGFGKCRICILNFTFN